MKKKLKLVPPSVTDLLNIRVRTEIEERLVSLYDDDTSSAQIKYFSLFDDMQRYFEGKVYVRHTVAKMLQSARHDLYDARVQKRLLVACGYRTPAIQQLYFLHELANLMRESPKMELLTAVNEAHRHHGYSTVAGHPTGGMVDVTLSHRDPHQTSVKKELDMGGNIYEFGPNAMFNFKNLTAEQRANRQLLRETMVKQGFAPSDELWWQFSYGDRHWAWCYSKKTALYDNVDMLPKTEILTALSKLIRLVTDDSALLDYGRKGAGGGGARGPSDYPAENRVGLRDGSTGGC